VTAVAGIACDGQVWIGADSASVSGTSLRKRLKSAGWAAVKDGREHGGTFLIGVRGQLFEVGSEYGVSQRAEPYSAIGCGADLTLGSLHTTAALGCFTPETRLEMALSAAERFSSGVRGPWCIRRTVNDSALAAAVQEDEGP
jgi:hypothetical protein